MIYLSFMCSGYKDACPLLHQEEGAGLGFEEQFIVSSLYSEVVYVVLEDHLSAHALERGCWPDFGDR